MVVIKVAKGKYTYELMGASYDPYQKGSYHNQEVIRLKEVSLNTLEEIDVFTCDKSQINFTSYLPERYQDKNHFSIRVINNYTDSSYFVRTIFSHPELKELLAGIKRVTITIDGKHKTIARVPSTPLSLSLWSKVERALEEKDQDTLDRFYHPNSNYAFKLKRYMNSPFFEEEFGALSELQKEFFDYPVFRKAFLNREKKFMATPRKVTRFTMDSDLDPTLSYQLKQTVPFQAEYATVQAVNQQNNQTDQEEFLGEEELEQAGYFEKTEAKKQEKNKKGHYGRLR